MLSLNVPLILILMVKTGLTFGVIQDRLREIDDALAALDKAKK